MREACQEVELDELQTFVAHKGYRVWLWIALCRRTRQILAFHLGDRRDTDAQMLYESLPDQVRQTARFFSDRYAVYAKIFPNDRHYNRGKPTNHLERLNLTLRQRVSPLVRRTLSFAKSIQGLTNRLAFFFNHYNYTT